MRKVFVQRNEPTRPLQSLPAGCVMVTRRSKAAFLILRGMKLVSSAHTVEREEYIFDNSSGVFDSLMVDWSNSESFRFDMVVRNLTDERNTRLSMGEDSDGTKSKNNGNVQGDCGKRGKRY